MTDNVENVGRSPDEAPDEGDLVEPNDDETLDSKKQEKQEHDTLKYHLLGPSLTKAGQDTVDQTKVYYIGFFPKASSQVQHDMSADTKSHALRLVGFRDHLQCLKRLQILQPGRGEGQDPDAEDQPNH